MPHDQAYLEAEKKIEENWRTREKKLNLSGMKLTELPVSIGKCTHLEELNLSNNQLTTLPDSLGQLTQLQSLNLESNQLTTLPESLRNVHRLNNLNIAQNRFTELPKIIGQLMFLTELSLYQNELTSLPDWLSNLKNLKKLYPGAFNFKGNFISDLPSSLAQLEHLRTLRLDNNPLNPALQSAYKHGLPAVMAYLRSLE